MQENMPGAALPNYAVERKLGTGSYATVWLARRINLNRPTDASHPDGVLSSLATKAF